MIKAEMRIPRTGEGVPSAVRPECTAVGFTQKMLAALREREKKHDFFKLCFNSCDEALVKKAHSKRHCNHCEERGGGGVISFS